MNQSRRLDNEHGGGVDNARRQETVTVLASPNNFALPLREEERAMPLVLLPRQQRHEELVSTPRRRQQSPQPTQVASFDDGKCQKRHWQATVDDRIMVGPAKRNCNWIVSHGSSSPPPPSPPSLALGSSEREHEAHSAICDFLSHHSRNPACQASSMVQLRKPQSAFMNPVANNAVGGATYAEPFPPANAAWPLRSVVAMREEPQAAFHFQQSLQSPSSSTAYTAATTLPLPYQQQQSQWPHNTATQSHPLPPCDTAASNTWVLDPGSIATGVATCHGQSTPMNQWQPQQQETRHWSQHRLDSSSISTKSQPSATISILRQPSMPSLPVPSLTRHSLPISSPRDARVQFGGGGGGGFLQHPSLYTTFSMLQNEPVAAAATVTATRQRPMLPALLSCPSDARVMSEHQTYLRRHIEVFCATIDDVTATVRGRNKSIHVGQVGIQCRHCRHVPMSNRIVGAVYFPATTFGIYQAAQNISAMHLQCGRCPHMPDAVKQRFVELLPTKNIHSKVGRKHWGQRAVEMFSLVDTDDGVFVQYVASSSVLLASGNGIGARM